MSLGPQPLARAAILPSQGSGSVASAICFDYTLPPLLMNNECIFLQTTKGGLVTSCPLSTVYRITHTYIYFWIIINVTQIDISCGISATLPTLQITQNYIGAQFLFHLKYVSFFNCYKRFNGSLVEIWNKFMMLSFSLSEKLLLKHHEISGSIVVLQQYKTTPSPLTLLLMTKIDETNLHK